MDLQDLKLNSELQIFDIKARFEIIYNIKQKEQGICKKQSSKSRIHNQARQTKGINQILILSNLRIEYPIVPINFNLSPEYKKVDPIIRLNFPNLLIKMWQHSLFSHLTISVQHKQRNISSLSKQILQQQNLSRFPLRGHFEASLRSNEIAEQYIKNVQSKMKISSLSLKLHNQEEVQKLAQTILKLRSLEKLDLKVQGKNLFQQLTKGIFQNCINMKKLSQFYLFGNHRDDTFQLIKFKNMHTDPGELEVTLKNANLTNKDILECIQNMQKLQKFKKLEFLKAQTFYGEQFSNENAIEIVKLLQSSKNELQHIKLVLVKAKINSIGATEIAKSISECRHLQYLSLVLYENQINSLGIRNLLQSTHVCEQLEFLFLQLQSQNANFPQENVSKIQISYDKSIILKNLKNIFIWNEKNNIEILGLIEIGKIVSRSPKLESLGLKLASNEIDNIAMTYFSQSLQCCKEILFITLDLSNNLLSDDGLSKLALSLQGLRKLKHLTLNLNKNQFRKVGPKQLGNTLSLLEEIKELNLNLGWNYLGVAGGLGLISYFSNLSNLIVLALNLEHCSIEDTFSLKLAQMLSMMLQIQKIGLNFNNNFFITNESLYQIGSSFQKCQNLSYLCLKFNNTQVNNQGCHFLVQKSNFKSAKLQSLYFEYDNQFKVKDFYDIFIQNFPNANPIRINRIDLRDISS